MKTINDDDDVDSGAEFIEKIHRFDGLFQIYHIFRDSFGGNYAFEKSGTFDANSFDRCGDYMILSGAERRKGWIAVYFPN